MKMQTDIRKKVPLNYTLSMLAIRQLYMNSPQESPMKYGAFLYLLSAYKDQSKMIACFIVSSCLYFSPFKCESRAENIWQKLKRNWSNSVFCSRCSTLFAKRRYADNLCGSMSRRANSLPKRNL